MYIQRYWGNYIGGSDDSLVLVDYLEYKNKEEITLEEIFAETGLDKLDSFRETLDSFRETDGLIMVPVDEFDDHIHYAITLITDLAALMLECKVSGGVNIGELGLDYADRIIRITATPREHTLMNKTLLDFTTNPLNYDLSRIVDEEEIWEMAQDCEEIRKELYG